jgi:HK97 family phage major capsid protein
MSNIATLTEKRNGLLARATELATQGLSTPARKEEYKRLLNESDQLSSDIALHNQINRSLDNNRSHQEKPAPVSTEVQAQITPEQRRANRDRAYRHFLRNGYQPSAVEQRDITFAGTDDGALISQDFDKAYVAAQRWAGPIATLVKNRKIADAGRPTKFTVSDDTASTMTYLSESGSTSGLEADPALNSTIPGTDTLVSTVLYSFQELEDANDLEQFLRDLAFVRASRAIEYALTLGKDNGTNTALPNSPSGGLLGNVDAGVTQSSGDLSAGPTLAQLAALAGSVDHAYYAAPGSGFMASPSVFNLLITQTDTTGRSLYTFNPETGLLMIAGKPLYVNNAMPAYNAASSPVVLFGDYSKSYAFLNGGGLRVRILSERYADQLLGAAVIYQRLGAATLVPGAVKALVSAAS